MQRPPPEPPADVTAAARQRAAARAARDWPRADALKAEIEAAGWKVIDRGTDFDLEPTAPPTVEEADITRYGSAAAVPSVLAEPPTARFTVTCIADDRPAELTRLLAGLRAHAPAGSQVVIVANDPSPGQEERLAAGSPDLAPMGGLAPEVTWTSVRLGHAAARNVGLRRARGEVVVLADASVELLGDALTPLADALADPGVAVCGAFGLVAGDLRRFVAAPGPAVDVIELAWLAFRRDDFVELGPLDEKLVVERHLDTWWSLVLRAGPAGRPPRDARRLDLPLRRHAPSDRPDLPAADLERLARRGFYRVLDRFRDRPDLLSGPPAAPRPAP